MYHTFGLECGVRVVVGLCLGLSNLEFRFLFELVGCPGRLKPIVTLTVKSFCFSFFLLALLPMAVVLIGEDVDGDSFFCAGYHT